MDLEDGTDEGECKGLPLERSTLIGKAEGVVTL